MQNYLDKRLLSCMEKPYRRIKIPLVHMKKDGILSNF